MTTYVLVHGAWGGAGHWHPIPTRLREAGHLVYTASLTGLGERRHLAHGGIDLACHIQDVVGLIDEHRLKDIVLVGHSYGGMVVTGVSALRGSKIRSLVYVDAFLPQDGQALWDITSDMERNHYIDGQRDTPGLIKPIFDMPGDRHPLLTLTQPVKLGGEEDQIGRKVYIWANGQPLPSFGAFYERCKADPAWETHTTPTGHMVMKEAPDQLMEILLKEG